MSVLADISIRTHVRHKHIEIDPYDDTRVQPASYDVALGKEFRIFDTSKNHIIDTQKLSQNLTNIHIAPDIILLPGQFILGATEEYFKLGTKIVARVEGKSSLGRLGLMVHSTAGWIDPGFRGNITLELSNNSPFPIILYAKMLIAQIAFMHTDFRVEKPYGSDGLNSRYQDSEGTIESRY